MKRKLLVIDDEPGIQLILEHYFADDYEVVLTANGRDAMAWLEQGHQVDVVVADCEMPFMNGLDFIQALRNTQAHQHTPIMMLSGTDDVANKISCLKLGADDYLVKPFNPEELELRINKILDRARAYNAG